MANKSKLINKKWVAEKLINFVENGDAGLSYYHMAELIEAKYIKPVFVKNEKGRGRPIKTYALDAKGSRLVALARFWPKAA